jgi:hypothetical protein
LKKDILNLVGVFTLIIVGVGSIWTLRLPPVVGLMNVEFCANVVSGKETSRKAKMDAIQNPSRDLKILYLHCITRLQINMDIKYS